MKLNLTITKLDGPLFAGEVDSVTLPGANGEMTVLPRHTALVTPLQSGTITVKQGSETKTFAIESGTLEVSQNQATVLV